MIKTCHAWEGYFEPAGSRLLILSPLVRGRKGIHQAVLEDIRKAGFVCACVDDTVYSLEDDIRMI